jgi:hypothetical protein
MIWMQGAGHDGWTLAGPTDRYRENTPTWRMWPNMGQNTTLVAKVAGIMYWNNVVKAVESVKCDLFELGWKKFNACVYDSARTFWATSRTNIEKRWVDFAKLVVRWTCKWNDGTPTHLFLWKLLFQLHARHSWGRVTRFNFQREYHKSRLPLTHYHSSR